MKKLITILCMTTAFLGNVQGQTILSPGDLAITAFNIGSPEGYSILALKDLEANTMFYVTDCGWSVSGNNFRFGEQCFGFTVTSAINAGTVINISTSGATFTTSGNNINSAFTFQTQLGSNTGFSNSGDQISIFQGTPASPTFIYAINNFGANWAADATNSNSSGVPAGLIAGQTAISYPSLNFFGKYNGGTITGVANDIKLAVANISNWSFAATTPSVPLIDYNFTILGSTISSANSITGFTLAGVAGMINGSMINVTVPFATNLMSVTANGFISANATVNPSFATAQDFSSPVNYTVTAENLSTQIYTVNAAKVPASTSNDILTFVLDGVTANISGGMINVTVPSSSNLSSLVATGTFSANATVNPSFASVTDFNTAKVFTVTAQDGISIQNYTVTAIKSLTLSSNKSITGFTLQGGYVGNIVGSVVGINVPFGTNLNALTAAGVLSSAASVIPSFDTPLDYSMMQSFKVTAENGSDNFFVVTVTSLPAVPQPKIVETFTANPTVSGWSIYTPKSLTNWILEVTTSTSRMVANGFGSAGISPMESWLITPKLSFVGSNLSVGYGGSFSFADAGTPKPTQVLFSTNYTGTGPVSLAGWNVIADDYALVTATGFKNFTASGSGYIAFKYSASSLGAIRWRLDDVTINGASLATPTVAGFVYNWEFANPTPLTLSGITSLGYVRNSISAVTGLSTIPGSLTFTIAGQLLGKNIAANVGLSGGVQFSIVDATGANTIRIPNSIYATLTASGTLLAEGNSVTVAGTLGQNNSLSQFTASSIVAADNSIKSRPAPLDVTTINESVEAKLIRVVALVDSTSWNAAPSGNGMNVNATINGVVYVVRVYAAVNDLFGKSFTKLFGRDNKVASLTIVGLGGQFNSTPASNTGYQIAPYSYADIQYPAPKSGENSIVSFQYLPQAGLNSSVVGTIIGNTVNVTVPFGTTVTGLVPTILLSANATINPASGVVPTYVNVDPQYFVNYTVFAENGVSKGYQLVVSVAAEIPTTTLSGENAMLSYVYYPQTALGLNTTVTGIIAGNNIYVTLPIGVTVTGLVPTITVSPKATLTTVSELVYKVTSESDIAALYSLNIEYIVSTTGISEFEAANAFEVYPNPTAGSFKIAAKAGLSFEIYNVLGTKVYDTTSTTEVIQVDAIATKGMYLVKVKGSSFSKRIVIE